MRAFTAIFVCKSISTTLFVSVEWMPHKGLLIVNVPMATFLLSRVVSNLQTNCITNAGQKMVERPNLSASFCKRSGPSVSSVFSTE